MALLDVQKMSVEYHGDRVARIVDGVSLSVDAGEIVGLAGESGSGKTTTMLAIARLLGSQARVAAERMLFNGHDLLSEERKKQDAFLGRELAVVFQNPAATFNPALSLGAQMTEGVRQHGGLGRREALALAEDKLAEMRIDRPRYRLRQRAYELSGGMQQRVALATAMMSKPSLVVADEPTSALDVTVQAEVMRLIRAMNSRHGTAFIIVSHDLALLSEICDRVMVMYRGSLVETIAAERVRQVEHPYSRRLLAAVPELAIAIHHRGERAHD